MTILTVRAAILATLILATTSSLLFAAPPASPQLTTILTNYGGKNKITDIRNITAKGQISDLRKGKEGPYRSYLAKDRKLRIEALVTPSSTGDVRVINGDKCWKNNGQSMNPVAGADANSLVAQYEALALPLTFAAAKLSLTYESPNVVRDHPVETYTLKVPNAPPLTIHFDVTSMLVHRVEWQGQNDANLAIEFADYRFIEGVLFPFKLVNYAADIKVSEITLSSITVNEQLATSTFKP